MANPVFGGFDYGDSTAVFVQSNPAYSSSVVHSPFGGFSFRSTPVGTGTAHRFEQGFNSTNGNSVSFTDARRSRFWMYVATAPASGSEEVFTAEATGNDLSIRIDSNRKLSVWQETTQYGDTGETVLALGTWYKIELDATSGAWVLRINGVQELTGADAVNNPITSIGFGKGTNRNGQGFDIYFDDWAVDTDDWPPADGACALLIPAGDGAFTTWTRGGADSGSDWGQVDDWPSNGDTDYLVSTATIGEASTVTFGSVEFGAIHGLLGILEAKRDGAANGSLTKRLRSGTTNSDTGTALGSGSTYNHRWSNGVHAVDPDTSQPWTQAGVDAVEFGAVEQSGANKSRITSIGLIVHADAPASAAGGQRLRGLSLSLGNPLLFG